MPRFRDHQEAEMDLLLKLEHAAVNKVQSKLNHQFTSVLCCVSESWIKFIFPFLFYMHGFNKTGYMYNWP